jgi:hypothetical protein
MEICRVKGGRWNRPARDGWGETQIFPNVASGEEWISSPSSLVSGNKITIFRKSIDGSIVSFLFVKKQSHKNILPENAISTAGDCAGKH